MTDDVYTERAQLVAVLTRLWPSYLGIDHTEPEWPVVYIESPSGQLSWHISKSDMQRFFSHLGEPDSTKGWDGHTTEEKYCRLAEAAAKTLVQR